MQSDVVDLRDFYRTGLGQVARRMIRRAIQRVWPDVHAMRLLGIGYTTPFLSALSGETERTIAVMPATLGVLRWPSEGRNLVTLAEGGELVSFENRYVCRDGSHRWLMWTAAPLLDEGLIYAAARDITVRKHAEEELQRYAHQRHFAFCVPSLETAAIRLDHDIWYLSAENDRVLEHLARVRHAEAVLAARKTFAQIHIAVDAECGN